MTVLESPAKVNQLLVEHYALLLCSALSEDYKSKSIEAHNRSIGIGADITYHSQQIAKIYETGADADFYLDPSPRKYFRLVMQYKTGSKQRSVHAFIDKQTGNVYKPASWKSPAKHIRYNLLDDNSRELCYSKCDWSGAYLYLR
ncbi:hypothetical protein SSZBM1_5 [Synechococcus phage S-SZBM1]|uniref:Uncharacterized protein n=1 Tax=Synechococcus phage S-SZBM1 TaxID=2926475 RepID=A0AC61TSB7_9CAUD|nr:hypothetical protein PP650_gp005 [Synechococcus phage S-SZBM1]UNH61122.1 hypothetical protein SSZBM1_5 [Synechococcus phage S-SZBM1]